MQYRVFIKFMNEYSGYTDTSYGMNLPDSGKLLYNGMSYFSFNSNYVMNISLYHKSDEKTILASKTVKASITDSNIIEVIFDIDTENSISE